MDLIPWGFGPEIEALLTPFSDRGLVPGRVLTAARETYGVAAEAGELRAEPSGRLRFGADAPQDLPAVGDWVALDVFPGSTEAIVHAVLPRRTALSRVAPGGARQLLAANVDLLVVASAADDPRAGTRLLRWRALAADAGVPLAVALTKADLLADREAAAGRLAASAGGAPVICASVHEPSGLDALGRLLSPRATHVLAGASGAGKSTLVNALLGAERLATSAVRADGRGRHTTTARELVLLPSGALLLDTPGLRTLAPPGVDGLVDELSADARCRFRDCSHSGEPGCAVREGLDAGDRERLDRLLREDAFLTLREEHGAARAERLRWRRIMGGTSGRSLAKRRTP